MDLVLLSTLVVFLIATESVIAYEHWWRYILTDRYHFNRRSTYAKYLLQNPSHHKFINYGVDTASAECKRLFKHSRWNCESNNLKKPFGDIVDLGCRETAFIYALTSAGMAYEMIRACSQGKISGCRKTCARPEDVNIKKTILVNATHTLNEACDDNLRFGYMAWNNFVFKGERSSDIRANFNIRNSVVGVKEIKKSAMLVCRCHGVSGSCMLQVCSEKVPDTFHKIGKEIYKKYVNAKYDIPDQRIVEENSKHMTVYRKEDNKMNTIPDLQSDPRRILAGNLIRRKRSNIFDVEELEYFERSPDFCNRSKYAIGTGNRVCKTKVTKTQKKDGIQGCTELCCQGKAFRRVKVRIKTNCKFHYCCKVTCNEEIRTIKQHYCL